jgi:CheY-like chemotaxis protein
MRVLNSGVAETGEFQWTEAGTLRPAGYDYRAVRIGSDTLLWVLRDISERLRRERGPAESDTRLEQALQDAQASLQSLRRQGAQVYEGVVQALTAAKMALEVGSREDIVHAEIERALSTAKAVVSKSLSETLTGVKQPAEAVVGQSSPVRVLLCDDEGMIRQLLTTMLHRSGDFVVVGEATNGHDALQKARALQPELVLLDLNMPVMTGTEALPLLRKVVPDATVVVMSGLTRDTVGDQLVDQGAATYIEKGTELRQVVDVLRDVVGRNRPAAAG